jgi:enoyl-CoA hydratase/carnithine racemase
MAEALDKMKAGMVAAYRDKSGRDDAEIEALMAAGTWLSAQEAVDLGLANRVEQPVRMAAHFDLSRFRNTPPQLAAFLASSTLQENEMSDPQKTRSRKPDPDQPATPQGPAPEAETDASDTEASMAGKPAEVAQPDLAPEPASKPPAAMAGIPARPCRRHNRLRR